MVRYSLLRLFNICLFICLMGCQPAPDFYDHEGKPGSLRDYQGQWVVINIWAEWCAPCLKEIPELNELQAKHAGKLVVLGVAMDELTPEQLQAQKTKWQISYRLVQSKPWPNLSINKPSALPVSYLLNPEGQLIVTMLGPQTVASIEKNFR